MCPPPDAKAKKAADSVESKGVLAEHYDVLMHFAIAHMCLVDGALPPHCSGRKTLNFFALLAITGVYCSLLAVQNIHASAYCV